MAVKPDTMTVDSTPHASPAFSDADQAGSCFSFPKEPLSTEQLAQHLEEKGMSVPNKQFLIATLRNRGYYHLRGYWITLERGDMFKQGVTINHVLDIESFNTELSLFIFRAIAPIEIALRSQITSVLSQRYGARALHHPEAFRDQEDFTQLQAIIKRETAQAIRAKKPCVLHNLERYECLPIWAEVENSSLGTLSRIVENLADKHVNSEIAAQFDLSRTHLKNWLRYLTQMRNTCAHHDRIYNRLFCVKPRLFKEHRGIDNARLFPAFIVLLRMHDALDPDRANLLRCELGRIVDAHPAVDLRPVGFPDNWREVLRIPDPGKRDLVRPRGRQGGHPPKDADAIRQALYQYDMRQGTVAEIAKRCGLSLSTLYKYVNLRKETGLEPAPVE